MDLSKILKNKGRLDFLKNSEDRKDMSLTFGIIEENKLKYRITLSEDKII